MQSIAADKAVPGMLQRISAKNIGSSLAGKAGFKHSADGSSVYLTIPGETTSRVATHSATATLFIQDGTDNNLSIAIRRPGQFKPFKSDSSANVVEAVFPKNVLDAHPEMLPHILRDIAEFVATGEYHDTAGAMAYNYSGSDAFKAQARDRIHEDAIARGDWSTAQKMVDAAAGVGRGAKVVFRGDASLWNTARDDRGLVFFTKDKDEAGVYAKMRGDFYPSGETIEEMRKSESGFLNEHVRRFFIMPEANIVALNEAKTLLEGKDFAKFAKRVIDSDKTLWQRIRGKEGSNTRTLEEYLGHVQTVLNNINGGIYDWEATVGWLNATAWNKFISPFLHSQGIDGVRYLDNAGKVDETTAMLRESMGKVKSADLATFDDSGELIPLSKRFDRTNSDIRFSSIGSAGAARLGITNLADAERMEKEGADRTEIWKKTGWWRGRDGKWRVEIPDIDTTDIENDLRRNMKDGRADIVSYWTWPAPLNKAYPRMGSVRLSVTVDREAYANFNHAGYSQGDMDSPEEISIYAENIDAVKPLLVHELQHRIQMIEGFAQGGSEFELKREGIETFQTNEDNSVGKVFMLEGTPYKSAHDAYRHIAGEVEARNAARRLSMTPEERAATPPWETEDVPEAEQIVQFGNGGVSAMAPMEATGHANLEEGQTAGDLIREIDAQERTIIPAFDSLPANVREAANAWNDLKDKAGKRALARAIFDAIPEMERTGVTADGKNYSITVNSIEGILDHMVPSNQRVKAGRVAFAVQAGKALRRSLEVYSETTGLVPVATTVAPVDYAGTGNYGILTLRRLSDGKTYLLHDENYVPQKSAPPRRLGIRENVASDRIKGRDISGAADRMGSSPTAPNARSIVQWLLENQEKTSADFDLWLEDQRNARNAIGNGTAPAVSQRLTDSGAEEGGGSAAMFSGARSAAAIFGGHVRVRPDGRMDYSMVKDSLVARTRMIQGSPAFQFPSQRRRLAQIAADPWRSVPRLPSFRRQFATTVEMIMTPPHCRRRGPAGTALEDRGDAVSRPRRRGRRGIHPPALEPVLPVIPAGLQRHLFLLRSFRP